MTPIKNLLILLLACAGLLRSAHAEGIDEVSLRKLKEATVLIRVTTPGGEVSGSGFFFKKNESAGFVVTNAHVISSQHNPLNIKVVLNSGQKTETTLDATTAAEDEDRDLAVLRVQMKNAPAPIGGFSAENIRETMQVYILGFPFGKELSFNSGNPAPTIGRGTVSSMRMDERTGDVGMIQIDGDINPGNSGGPIVDSKGALVGIAVAKVRFTNIGMAIPNKSLQAFFKGRVRTVRLKDQATTVKGEAKFKAEIELIDPLREVNRVSLIMAPKERALASKWEPPNGNTPVSTTLSDEYQLKVNDALASGELIFRGPPGGSKEYVMQAKITFADGKVQCTEPNDQLLSFAAAPEPVAAPHTPPVGEAPPVIGSRKNKDADDWLGGDPKTESKLPELTPVAGGASLLGVTSVVVDANVSTLKVDASKLVPRIFYSADAKSFYYLETGGRVHKASVPEFKEQKIIDLKSECKDLAVSKAGLLVLVTQLQEVWVLDEETLKVKGKSKVPGASRIASSRGTNLAFASGGGDELSIVDLTANKIVRQLKAHDLAAKFGKQIKKHADSVVLTDFHHPTVTPDGKYFFCDGFECLHRFKINGSDLVYEEMGPRIGQNAQTIEISPDSAYISLPSGGGNYNVSDHPKVGTYSTYVYKVSNLQMPVLTVSSGAYPRSLGYDRAGGCLYAQNFDTSLLLFSLSGIKEKEYKIAPRGDESHQFLVHPSGRKILMLTENHIFWVELPKD